MSDHRWGYRGEHRPPWWPEDEAWPPTDEEGRRRVRSHFRRRMGCFFLFMFLVVASLVGFVAYLIGSALGAGRSAPGAILIGLLVLLVLAILGRIVRRLAAPVGDLIEASGRIEAGDFSSRVQETGPREVRALARAFNAMSAKLEEAEQDRRSALADVSHELRTPLTVIQGNLEALVDGVYPADAAHLEPILAETRILERLIEDLRTLTLAEAGSLVLHREPTDLGALLTDVAASYLGHAEQSGISLSVTAADDLPILDIDPARLREVVSNLLTNALRHTPREGTVELSAGLAGDQVEVTVHDTGSGIPPDQLDRIFERFYRSSDSPGSGLGLPIARGLVEAHGGTITATSDPAAGTTIQLALPREQASSTG
ncbi:MAG TPA: ATP-binding protein [Candidatus Limnocylindria bacterium]|nr:ATP-binding protein [Candidatus Limnocylindria bacterium]